MHSGGTLALMEAEVPRLISSRTAEVAACAPKFASWLREMQMAQSRAQRHAQRHDVGKPCWDLPTAAGRHGDTPSDTPKRVRTLRDIAGDLDRDEGDTQLQAVADPAQAGGQAATRARTLSRTLSLAQLAERLSQPLYPATINAAWLARQCGRLLRELELREPGWQESLAIWVFDMALTVGAGAVEDAGHRAVQEADLTQPNGSFGVGEISNSNSSEPRSEPREDGAA